MLQGMLDDFNELDDKFFDKEERNGFVITGLMKRAWACQLKVLIELDRICENHNIKWFAHFGTLLGAVRHNGFIPWDDDIDICMLRPDYEKFYSIVKDELRGDYYLFHPFADDVKYRNNIPRFVNSTSINFNDSFLKEFYGCPYICGVDIFPLDGVPNDAEEWELQKKIVHIISLLEEGYPNMNVEEITQYIGIIENMCGVQIKCDRDVRRQLAILLDAIYRNVPVEEAVMITSVSQETASFSKSPLQKSWYDKMQYLPFENIKIPVPFDYKKVLKAVYGPDYMIPKKIAAGHDYPFYKKQKCEIKKDYFNESGYEERERRVAELLGLDMTEVFEYKFIEQNENGRKYLYFCQKEMRELFVM